MNILGKNCVLGQNVVIKAGVILGDNVHIEDNVILGKTPMKFLAAGHNPEPAPTRIADNVIIGANTIVYAGCTIGAHTLLADYVSVRENVTVGERCILGRNVCVENDCSLGKRCKLQTNAYITAYSTLEDYVFIAPGVVTSNDNFIGRDRERFKHYKGVTVKRGGRIGAGAVILPGITIGADALIGAGSVVTHNIPAAQIWFGSPARYQRHIPESQMLENQEFFDG